MSANELKPSDPYCSNCNYALTGVTDSSKCPECGKPLVEVLVRRQVKTKYAGRRFRSTTRLLGLPLIDIALGSVEGESAGRAKGFIAIGDSAIGWLAIGGVARGFVAIGGVAFGVFAAGAMSFGLLSALGFCAIGGLAAGILTLGALAHGLTSIGYVAQGTIAIGAFAHGKKTFGPNTMGGRGPTSPDAQSMFDSLSWYFGSGWPSMSVMMQAYFLVLLIVLAMATGVAMLGLLKWARHRPGGEPRIS